MFQKGDIIRWFEVYSDVMVPKDSGVGIIVDIIELSYVEKEYRSYRVYRVKKKDYMSFNKSNLEKLKGEQNELHTI